MINIVNQNVSIVPVRKIDNCDEIYLTFLL